MAKILSFASGKGGVGKTLLAAAFGIHLSRKGKKVLLIDGDMGMRNMDLILGLENDCFYHILDFAKGKCFLSDVVLPAAEGLDFLPAAPSDVWETIFAAAIDTVLEDVKDAYDYILMDCPAGKGDGIRYAAKVSDRLFLVVAPSWASKRNAEQLLAFGGREGKCSFLLNQFSNIDETKISLRDMMETLEEEYLSGVIPYSEEADRLAHQGELLNYSAKGAFAEALSLFEKAAFSGREISISRYEKLISAADGERTKPKPVKVKGLSWQSGSAAYRWHRRR